MTVGKVADAPLKGQSLTVSAGDNQDLIKEKTMRHAGEFVKDGPLPRNGLTSVEAEVLMRHTFPEIPAWVCWEPAYAHINGLVPDGKTQAGGFMDWKWQRVAAPYPALWYRDDRAISRGLGARLANSWTGVLKITAPDKRDFLIFSFLASTGSPCARFLVSTTDNQLLDGFVEALRTAFDTPTEDKRIHIHVVNGPDIELAADNPERIFMAESLRVDIERQVDAFFKHRERFASLNVPYRRGFLFVGVPGCGKTMFVRHLARHCHRAHRTSFWSILAQRETDEADLIRLFEGARTRAPSLLILEDLDSLTKESRITRSSFLAQLDGLAPTEGVLVIGTTNHPHDIDPALVHRPSRFDRVWQFPTPNTELRRDYLRWALPVATEELIAKIVSGTDGWNFAYLNELRVTAALLGMPDDGGPLSVDAIGEAFKLLSVQFKGGKCNHVPPKENSMGFSD
ncbi:MAG: ATP-binding protein [Kiritimatiellaeota bacterium]|nr:ATP-binding protein [Kiritimatiellota bacterium]